MNRRFPRAGPPGGFTLIEVLIALVILAVGLLGLQALGVIAVRSTALAERNTRAAALATEHLEDALERLRVDELPEQYTCTLAGGDRVAREVRVNPNNDHLVRVTVTVTPEPRGSTPRPLTLTAHAYSPEPFSHQPATAACP